MVADLANEYPSAFSDDHTTLILETDGKSPQGEPYAANPPILHIIDFVV